MEKTLTIEQGAWSDEAGALLARSAHDPLVGVETLRALVESGESMLFEVQYAGRLVCAYVMRLNQCQNGTEAVLVAAGANMPGVRLTPVIVPAIERQFFAADRIRINASRPGMERQLQRLGYQKQATIFTKAFHVL